MPPPPKQGCWWSQAWYLLCSAELSCPAELESLLTRSPSQQGRPHRRRHCFFLAIGLDCPDSLVQKKNQEKPFPCSDKCPFLWSRSKCWSLRRNSYEYKPSKFLRIAIALAIIGTCLPGLLTAKAPQGKMIFIQILWAEIFYPLCFLPHGLSGCQELGPEEPQ